MAKSPVGGSRAYLKGRIGSDVYTLGKDGKGKTQQIVRSLAEEVANPRTSSQMFGRMVMTTVMQAAKALNPIIDHSFDGVPTGQPSISQFIKENYKLIAADAKANPSQYNSYGLNKYQEKGLKMGKYVLSNGSYVNNGQASATNKGIEIEDYSGAFTVKSIREAMGVGNGGYLTYVGMTVAGGLYYFRISLKEGLSDTATIDAASAPSQFDVEGNCTVSFSIDSVSLKVEIDGTPAIKGRGLISTAKVNGKFKHSRCKMEQSDYPTWCSDVALPTYPVGSEQYLNGGDL